MIKVLQIGLGPLGQKIVRFGNQRKNIKFIGAVDLNPAITGKDLGDICKIEKLNVKITNSVKEALKKKKADVVILTTVSGINKIVKQIENIANYGIPVVSTCEELSYPWKRHSRTAKKIDGICRANNIACLGTGVNPGFLMDYLPCVISSVNQNVKKLSVFRIQDASVRRIPFQKKIGVGLTRKEFNDKVRKKIIRHVGLPESIDLIAACMNWKVDNVKEVIKPVIAKEKITKGFRVVEKGMVCGVEQIGRGFVNGKEVIKLVFKASLAETNPNDTIEIKGEPDIKSVIEGGVNGDIATCAITLNSIRSILKMKPGLHTMLDIPVPGYFR